MQTPRLYRTARPKNAPLPLEGKVNQSADSFLLPAVSFGVLKRKAPSLM
jgi:hypothetical protein